MVVKALARWRGAALSKAGAVVLAVAASPLVQAAPAAADDICGEKVGGAILVKYRELGGEDGALGCPTSGELVTPNGRGRYNTFERGAIYWTAETNAHPVWGAIRDKWGGRGWENGKLGFPVGDELTNPENGDVDVHVFPTDLGFEKAKDSYDKLWDQAFGTVPYPKRLTEAQGSSMYTQLACHARYVFKLPNGEWNTHESWDMESWRPDVSWDYAMNPLVWPLHKCNWT
ncbi:DUF2599 domain-containing protein [Streptomyces sp. NPDC006314]|uniref:DUF2599 domain-containing protein n=1 Tax=Streptomyces sp. NPDC006314 TaxID=3154475 RepID=UPI0033BA5466